MAIELDIRSDSRQAQRDLAQLNNRVANIDNQAQAASRSFSQIGRTIRLASAALAAFGAGTVFTRSADSLRRINTQLNLVSTNAASAVRAQRQLLDVSIRTRTSQEQLVNVYARLSRSTRELGASERQLITATTAIGQALQISGASAESANAALVQLGQGLASGQLRGEELNSVLEQTPRIAQAIAAELNVSVGALRSLAAEGELTTEVVFNALINQSRVINEEFGRVETTVGSAFTVFRTGVTQAIGQLDMLVGFTSGLITVLTTTGVALSNLDETISLFTASAITGFIQLRASIGGFADAVSQEVSEALTFDNVANTLGNIIADISGVARNVSDQLGFDDLDFNFEPLQQAWLNFVQFINYWGNWLYEQAIGGSWWTDFVAGINGSIFTPAAQAFEGFINLINDLGSSLNSSALAESLRGAVASAVEAVREDPALAIGITLSVGLIGLAALRGDITTALLGGITAPGVPTAIATAFRTGLTNPGAIAAGARNFVDDIARFLGGVNWAAVGGNIGEAIAISLAGAQRFLEAARSFGGAILDSFAGPGFTSAFTEAASRAAQVFATLGAAGFINDLLEGRSGQIAEAGRARIQEAQAQFDEGNITAGLGALLAPNFNSIASGLDAIFDTLDATFAFLQDALGDAGAIATGIGILALVSRDTRASIGSLATSFATFPTEIARFVGQRGQARVLRGQLAPLQTQQSELQGAQEALRGALRRAGDAINGYTSEVERLRRTGRLTQEERDRLAASIRAERQARDSANRDLQRTATNLSSLNSRLGPLQTRVDALQQSINAAATRARDAFTNLGTNVGGAAGAAVGFQFGGDIVESLNERLRELSNTDARLANNQQEQEQLIAVLTQIEQRISEGASGANLERLLEGRIRISDNLEDLRAAGEEIANSAAAVPAWADVGIRVATSFIGQGVGAGVGAAITNYLVTLAAPAVGGGIAAAFGGATVLLNRIGVLIATAFSTANAVLSAAGARIAAAFSAARVFGSAARSIAAAFGPALGALGVSAFTGFGAAVAAAISAAIVLPVLALTVPEDFSQALQDFLGFSPQWADTITSFIGAPAQWLVDFITAVGDLASAITNSVFGESQPTITVEDRAGAFGAGQLEGFASGGKVSGPGTGTSDSIVARLSNGEFVVNARAARANYGLLNAINGGAGGASIVGGLPAFQNGGSITSNVAQITEGDRQLAERLNAIEGLTGVTAQEISNLNIAVTTLLQGQLTTLADQTALLQNVNLRDEDRETLLRSQEGLLEDIRDDFIRARNQGGGGGAAGTAATPGFFDRVFGEEYQQRFATDFEGALSNSFNTALQSGTLSGIGEQFLDQFTSSILSNLSGSLASEITDLFDFGDIFSSLGSGGGFGSLFGGISSFFGGFFQDGGVVPGNPNQMVPIIAHGGEVVLNQEQQRALFQTTPNNGSPNEAPITINLDIVGNVDDATRRAVFDMLPEIAQGVQANFQERGVI